MNAGKAVYGILSANSGVTDIVGTNIFPEIAEQETAVPFIVYQLQSVDPDDTHDGPSKLDEVRFEFLCYADSYNAAADLGVAVRAALDRVSGTYNGVHVESIQFNDVDVNIEYDPRRYSQVLTFTFRIKRDDVTIALGTPVTGAVLGDLSDVDVTGVTNGQLIAYNSTSGNWEAADDAGGANELNDLSDASVSLPSDGEVLIYSGGEFVNDNIAISNVTGLQAALDAAPDNLRELTDVTISGLADNDYLQYNSATGVWENSSLIVGRNGEQYTGNYDSEAETLLDGATETVELYYTAQADGDGLHEDAQSDTPTSGYDIRRKLYYAEKAQADPDTSADWTQFADIADDTAYATAKATLLAYLKARTGGTVPISLKMTWEEVAQAPAFTGLLNESYGSGAEAAYSIRRLNGNVTDCMVIRRASDSTTTTIGFDSNGNIDESAIETFCTGTTCTVQVWRDQSGNGNDAEQTTPANQPTIYTGGQLVKEGGRLAIDGGYFAISNAPITAAPISLAMVAVHTDGTNENMWNANEQGTNTNYFYTRSDANNTFDAAIYGGGFVRSRANVDSGQFLGFAEFLTSGSNVTAQSFVDGGTGSTLVSTAPPTGIDVNDIGQFQRASTATYDCNNMQELVIWNSDKSSVRTDIESNIGDYFTQNTPLLDTYSGAAACYSLRLMRTAYTGDAVEVYNGSSYADIGFNVFGELDTVALADHCGSNDGFVSTWYDQSGNSNDATQTTTANMPKIYDGTTGVVTENGKPAVEFDGSNDNLAATSAVVTGAEFFCSNVLTMGTTGQPWGDQGTLGVRSYQASSTNLRVQYNTDNGSFQMTGDNSGSGQRLKTTRLISGTQEIFDNGSSATTATNTFTSLASNNVLRFGMRYNSSTFFDGKLQEFIMYTSDQSSNRTGIEDNINTFYDIYS